MESDNNNIECTSTYVKPKGEEFTLEDICAVTKNHLNKKLIINDVTYNYSSQEKYDVKKVIVSNDSVTIQLERHIEEPVNPEDNGNL